MGDHLLGELSGLHTPCVYGIALVRHHTSPCEYGSVLARRATVGPTLVTGLGVPRTPCTGRSLSLGCKVLSLGSRVLSLFKVQSLSLVRIQGLCLVRVQDLSLVRV